MDISDFVTLLGVVLTFLVSSISLFISIRLRTMSQYVGTISNVRTLWVRDLRQEIAEFVKCALNCLHEVEDWDRNFSSLNKQVFIVQTFLGKRFTDLSDSIDQITCFVVECHKSVSSNVELNDEKMSSLLINLRKNANCCFISQWNAAKRESSGKTHRS